MRRISFIILIFLVAFSISCTSYVEDGWVKCITQNEKKALDSKEVVEDIFMGFKFGMTKTEFDNHMSYLHSEGRVSSIKQIVFNFGGLRCPATIYGAYYNQKLYEVSLNFEDKRLPSIYIFTELEKIINERKDSLTGCISTIGGLNNDLIYKSWFKRNLRIDLSASTTEYNGAKLSYLEAKTDMRLRNLRYNIQKSEEERQKQNNKEL